MTGLLSNGSYILQVGNDETVLWEGNASTGTLSEAKTNFEYLKIYCIDDQTIPNTCTLELLTDYDRVSGLIGFTASGACNWRQASVIFTGDTFNTYYQQFSLNVSGKSIYWANNFTAGSIKVVKIVGINRKAGV